MVEGEDIANEEARKVSSIDMENIMESMTRITFCGLGGTIVGLSLEKRLESMKIATAEGIAAAARRKRGAMASSHQRSLPLSVTWAVSCMVFCSIIEVSRLASPSMWIAKRLNFVPQETPSKYSESAPNEKPIAAALSVADHSIGGSIAGIVCSFGRRMYSRTSALKMHSSRRFSGLLPGLAIGVAAGTIQLGIQYGTDMLEESSKME